MKLIFILILLGVVTVGKCEKERFDNFRVYRVQIQTEEQLDVFKNIEQYSSDYDLWQESSQIGGTMDILVPPYKLADFSEILEKYKVQAAIKVSNVQTLIDNERPAKRARAGEFDWNDYHTLDEIYAWFDELKNQYSHIQNMILGTTEGGNEMGGIIIPNPDKPVILIEANTHAREWITSATATWIINELLSSTDTAVKQLTENYEWWIFPVSNPDGFVYTHNTNRLWRKNRSNQGEICYGVDPNRNWGYMWSNENNNVCSETFPGREAFSEIETSLIKDMVQIEIGNRIKMFLSFHSYSQLILYPYCFTDQPVPDAVNLRRIGDVAAAKLEERYGTHYTVQSGYELYYHAGTVIDWTYGAQGINMSFTYEFRDTGNYGFVLPADQIIPNSQEVLDSLIALISEAESLGYM